MWFLGFFGGFLIGSSPVLGIPRFRVLSWGSNPGGPILRVIAWGLILGSHP